MPAPNHAAPRPDRLRGHSAERPLVVVPETIPQPCEAWLRERCAVSHELAALPEADGLVVRTYTRVDEALLDRAPRLRVVGRAGVGLDNIHLAACGRRGIPVVYTPAANVESVTELVMAFMLDALRPREPLDRPLPPEQWEDARRRQTAPRTLAGRTLGVYGLGRNGSSVARIAHALGMRVLFCDLQPSECPFAERVDRERLLAESDVVTVHVDGRPSNRRLLDTGAFARMRPDVVFINTARGFVLDAPALAAFMKEHPAARAMLDVHEPEPFGRDYPLLGIPNVHLFAHIGSATADSKERMGWVVRDVWRVLGGEPPVYPAAVAAEAP